MPGTAGTCSEVGCSIVEECEVTSSSNDYCRIFVTGVGWTQVSSCSPNTDSSCQLREYYPSTTSYLCDITSYAVPCKNGAEVECVYDSDCGVVDGRQEECRNNICKLDDCRANSDCDSGYCCELIIGSGSKTTTYGCVPKGTVKDDIYLCDPPGWNTG